MPETFNGYLAEQLKDPEFAEAYQRVSQQMDSELAAVQIARSDLARRVLETVEGVPYGNSYPSSANAAKVLITTALCKLFAKEGVNVVE